MSLPNLTFFCELQAEDLQALFANPAPLEDLRALQARLSLGILDFSTERAEVVRRLNEAGIPVTAWLLLPEEEGYWFNLDNAAQARARYEAFRGWTSGQGLKWAGVGLDIEPDLREQRQFANSAWPLLGQTFKRIFANRRFSRAQAAYKDLAKMIRSDGFVLETYQLPMIQDERKVHSSLLRRTLGLVDIPADREVWTLYSSLFRPYGIGYLWSYAPEAQAIGIGSTGGGMSSGIGDPRPLTWEEFARDLRLAWYWTDHLYIFSLEGCQRQGFLERLKAFGWDFPIFFPDEQAEVVNRWRSGLQAVLWLSRHLKTMIISGVLSVWIVKSVRRWLRR